MKFYKGYFQSRNRKFNLQFEIELKFLDIKKKHL
jgi:hypothetical protein